jgi:hypothetical protein
MPASQGYASASKIRPHFARTRACGAAAHRIGIVGQSFGSFFATISCAAEPGYKSALYQ